jgi:hypothetical protein
MSSLIFVWKVFHVLNPIGGVGASRPVRILPLAEDSLPWGNASKKKTRLRNISSGALKNFMVESLRLQKDKLLKIKNIHTSSYEYKPLIGILFIIDILNYSQQALFIYFIIVQREKSIKQF